MRFLTISFYSGIGLLILCILLLVSPLRERFSNATQRIQGFGLNLEVSVLTLLVLISAALMTSGIWMQLRDVDNRLRSFEQDKINAQNLLKSTQDQLENAKRISVIAYFTLEGVVDYSKLKAKSMSCKYTDGSSGDKDAIVADPSVAHPRRIKVIFTDVQRETIIDSLIITNSETNESWVNPQPFKPLQPTLDLAKSTGSAAR